MHTSIFANHKNAKDHVERCKKSHMPTSQKSGPIDQYFIFENKEEEESGESETLSFDFCSEFGCLTDKNDDYDDK